MSDQPEPTADSSDHRLQELAAAYLESRLEIGGPTASEWLEQYPEEAQELEPLLAEVDRLFQSALSGPPSLTLPCLIGEFELTAVLGTGSFATVYLATDLRHHREVAVKVLDRDPGPFGSRDRQFIHDRRVAAAVRHPAIISLFDSGVSGEYRYLVMELGRHGTLREALEKEPEVWSAERASTFVAALARAVAAAHEVGIIHRDIKPSNVLIDADGSPKLTDFGLALDTRDIASDGDGSAIAGFPPYVAPEIQLLGIGAASARSDLFSLGVLLHRLVYGLLPSEIGETVRSKSLREVPKDLQRIIKRAIQTTASERHSTAQELAEELDRFLQYRPLHCERTSGFKRVALWANREPFQAALAGMLLLTLSIGIWAGWNEVHRRGEVALRQQLEFENAGFRSRVADETERAILAEVQVTYRTLAPDRRGEVRKRLKQALEVRSQMNAGVMSEERLLQVRSLYSQSLALPDFMERQRFDLPYYDFDFWRVARHPISGAMVLGLSDHVVSIDQAPTETAAVGPQQARTTPVFSPSGNYLAVIRPYGGWELRESRPPFELLLSYHDSSESTERILSLWFDTNDQTILTVDSTGIIQEHRAPFSGESTRRTLDSDSEQHLRAEWSCAAWSPDGTCLVLGGLNGELVACQRDSTGVTTRWSQQIAQGQVDTISVAQDGTIGAGTHDGRVQVFEPLGRIVRQFGVSSFGVSQICFSQDSQMIFAGTRNTAGRGWELETGAEVLKFEGVPLQVSADNRVLVFGGADKAGWIEILQPEGMIRLGGHRGVVCRTVWSRDGRRLASLDSDGRVVVRDLESSQILASFDDGPGDYFAENTAIALSGDGRFLATVSGGPMSVARIRHVASGLTLMSCRMGDGFERMVPLTGCQFLLVRQERTHHRQLRTVSYQIGLEGCRQRHVIREPFESELGFVHAEISPDGHWYAWFGPRYPESARRWEIWNLNNGQLARTIPKLTSRSAIYAPDSTSVRFADFVEGWQVQLPLGGVSSMHDYSLAIGSRGKWHVANRLIGSKPLATVEILPTHESIVTLHSSPPGIVETSLTVDPTGERLAFGLTGEPLTVVNVRVLERAIRRDFPEAFSAGEPVTSR